MFKITALKILQKYKIQGFFAKEIMFQAVSKTVTAVQQTSHIVL